VPSRSAYCSYCGQPFLIGQTLPLECASCGQITYQNPIPVAVTLLAVDDGLLVVRRGIDPQKGKLALPGGYINLGETWQEACARELQEETGVMIDPAEIKEFRVCSGLDDKIFIFGLASCRSSNELPPFNPTDETTERLVIYGPYELAFPLNTQMVAEFFASGVSTSSRPL
jgi:ADP-ribose pyrophosphatase YjhB (NUDIX family)